MTINVIKLSSKMCTFRIKIIILVDFFFLFRGAEKTKMGKWAAKSEIWMEKCMHIHDKKSGDLSRKVLACIITIMKRISRNTLNKACNISTETKCND